MIRRLLSLLLVVVLALLVGLDFGAKSLAQRAVAKRVKDSTGAASASAHISGFPFLYDVIGRGRVNGLTVDMTNVPAGPLVLQSVVVDLQSVTLDRHVLYAKHKVDLTGVARGTARIDVSAPELSAVAHVTVTIASGRLVASAGGTTVPATATVSGDTLTVAAAGAPIVSVDLARNPVVPACQMTVAVTPTGLEATCTMAPVPPAVVAAISAHS
jgi:hypothetical protein